MSVFDEKIAIDKTKLTQKIAFVAEDNFTIPVFSIKYFDTKTKEIKTISTKEIQVKVKNAKKKEALVIKKETSVESSDETNSFNTDSVSNVYLVVASLIGFIFGILIMLLKPWSLFRKEKKSISTKDPKTLLIKLLPFKDDKDVQEIVDILENNIYYGDSVKLDNKRVKIVIARYGIN